MTRFALLPLLAVTLLGFAACGSSASNSLDTLPPIRTTSSTSTTSTTIDPREVVYIVQPGDNVNEIARAYQVTAQRIVELNDLPNNGETIQPGQELKIPNIRIDVTLPTTTSTSEAP